MRPASTRAPKGRQLWSTGQLHQGAQTVQFGQVLAVGQQSGLKILHFLAQTLIFFPHAHQIEIAGPDALHRILHGPDGFEHGPCELQPHLGGQTIQSMRALVPGIHAQKQNEQNARKEEKTPQCHVGVLPRRWGFRFCDKQGNAVGANGPANAHGTATERKLPARRPPGYTGDAKRARAEGSRTLHPQHALAGCISRRSPRKFAQSCCALMRRSGRRVRASRLKERGASRCTPP